MVSLFSLPFTVLTWRVQCRLCRRMFLHFALSLLVQHHVQSLHNCGSHSASHRRFNASNFSIISDGVFLCLFCFVFEGEYQVAQTGFELER